MTEFDTKKDFSDFYATHKECIDNGTGDGSIKIRFIDDDNDTVLFDVPDKNAQLSEVLKELPDDIKVELIEN